MLQDKQARKDISELKGRILDLESEIRVLRNDTDFAPKHMPPMTVKDVIRELIALLGYEIRYEQPAAKIVHKKEK